jgi:predicted NUDIX family phosphoesterase
MSKKAHILVLRADSVPFPLDFGIRAIGDDALGGILAAQAWIGPRPVLEDDPSFVQFIPYILVRQGDRLLAYVRAESGGEARLHGKFSVGVGGHVDLPDVLVDETLVTEKGEEVPINRIDVLGTLTRSACREISEEIGMAVPESALSWTHLIHTRATPVDAVHLGLVAIIDVDEAGIAPLAFESAIADARFETVAELAAGRVGGVPCEAETWTGLVLRMLVEGAAAA